MTRTLVVVVAATALLPAMLKPATAQRAPDKQLRTASIGTVRINLVRPEGYCFLDEAHASDSRMLSAMSNAVRGRNRLLAGIANCQELAHWRSGKRPLLDHHGNFQTFLRTENRKLTVPRAQLVESVCAQFRQKKIDIGKLMAESKKRAEGSVAGLKVNEQKFLGEIETTANACYAGMYQRFKAQNGTIKSQLGVFATVLIKGKLVYIYLFAPESGAPSMKALITASKGLVKQFLSANGG